MEQKDYYSFTLNGIEFEVWETDTRTLAEVEANKPRAYRWVWSTDDTQSKYFDTDIKAIEGAMQHVRNLADEKAQYKYSDEYRYERKRDSLSEKWDADRKEAL